MTDRKKCPKCGGNMFNDLGLWVCENHFTVDGLIEMINEEILPEDKQMWQRHIDKLDAIGLPGGCQYTEYDCPNIGKTSILNYSTQGFKIEPVINIYCPRCEIMLTPTSQTKEGVLVFYHAINDEDEGQGQRVMNFIRQARINKGILKKDIIMASATILTAHRLRMIEAGTGRKPKASERAALSYILQIPEPELFVD